MKPRLIRARTSCLLAALLATPFALSGCAYAIRVGGGGSCNGWRNDSISFAGWWSESGTRVSYAGGYGSRSSSWGHYSRAGSFGRR